MGDDRVLLKCAHTDADEGCRQCPERVLGAADCERACKLSGEMAAPDVSGLDPGPARLVPPRPVPSALTPTASTYS
ncbi:hypothetical protein EVAR_92740_1 [Eumeta japonica]|uniref:Uncharacterized protein n=1 Tax=Eumeta variegata TaxID=151549 RepID=A0A4C1SXZ7_EUMVA|nr:hypothetical protein EVAR_92740_1 [Eumeta japonica]